jgi:hypothetical protein
MFKAEKLDLATTRPGRRSIACLIAVRRSAEQNPLDRRAAVVKTRSRLHCGEERVLCDLEVDRRRHIAIIPVPPARDVRTILSSARQLCVAKK